MSDRLKEFGGFLIIVWVIIVFAMIWLPSMLTVRLFLMISITILFLKAYEIYKQ